jgi:hypothetical protein
MREHRATRLPAHPSLPPGAALYPWLLGDSYGALPGIIRRMHAVNPRVEASGAGTVTHGTNWITRMMARALGFPAEGVDRPLAVSFLQGAGSETISRSYPDATLITHQRPAGPAGSGRLAEGFGPFQLVILLVPSYRGLDFDLQEVGLWGRNLPKWLQPRLSAREFVEADWYRFEVEISLPVLGRLIRYEGRLRQRI